MIREGNAPGGRFHGLIPRAPTIPVKARGEDVPLCPWGENFAALGAIGPDPSFFLPDFRDEHGIAISSVLVSV